MTTAADIPRSRRYTWRGSKPKPGPVHAADRAHIFARQSVTREDRSVSCDVQDDACRAFAVSTGWDVVGAEWNKNLCNCRDDIQHS